MKILNAKCPNCGAALDITTETEKIICNHCGQTLIIDDEIIKIAGSISVNGIETDDELLASAYELLDMNEFLKAKKKFLEYSEKNPDDYQGWLGLLVCRTRNFTIKDNNIIFKTDVEKYYSHFLRVAPEDVKNKYIDEIENYLNPGLKKNLEKVEENIEKGIKNGDFKKYFKYFKYIPRIFLISGGFAFLVNSSAIGGLLWILAGLLLVPQFREKMKVSPKKSVIFSIIFTMTGMFVFAINYPTDIEGTWIAEDENLNIEFKSSNNVIMKHSDGTTITGTYKSKYNNSEYIITITDNKSNTYILKYNPAGENNKKLCTYKNESCINYFKDKNV